MRYEIHAEMSLFDLCTFTLDTAFAIDCDLLTFQVDYPKSLFAFSTWGWKIDRWDKHQMAE